ncbi:MAG TPA: serine hydrolase domain-containing protein [Bacillota bacterium]|nr:serine hydrolase domain-containing protein [Bacillota bacterium]
MTFTRERVSEFESFVTAFMAEQGVPGVSIAIGLGDDLLYAKAFGLRDKAAMLPMTTETILGIASITKSFTATAVGILVDEGRLSFDDPVIRHLPEFTIKGRDVSGVRIHHLLSHTTGLQPLPTLGYSLRGNTVADEVGNQAKSAEEKPEPSMNTVKDLLAYMAQEEVGVFGQPGEYFSYSNDCYGLLGEIIARVSGIPYQRFVRERVLQPLGMERTLFSYEELMEHDNFTALYYRDEREELQVSHRWQVAPPFTAGGWLKSTAVDLVRHYQMYAAGGAYLGRRIISSEIARLNTTPRCKYALQAEYAHGLKVTRDYQGVTLVEHGGSLKGVASNAGFVPERKISAVVLCNLSGVPVDKLWLAAINLALGLPLETPRIRYSTKAWPAHLLDLYPGQYRSGEGAEFTITREAEDLWVQLKQQRCKLTSINDVTGLLVHKGVEQEMRFYLDAAGQPLGVGYGVRIIPRVG